jgi:hypothetical protein
MKAPRGRAVVLSIGFLGLATLAAAGIASRDRIREEYWLWKLEEGDETEKEAAVLSLGELRSLRAVRGILQWACSLQRPAESGWALQYTEGLEQKFFSFPTRADYDRARSLFMAIGKSAVSKLTILLGDNPDPPTRFWAEAMLAEFKGERVFYWPGR